MYQQMVCLKCRTHRIEIALDQKYHAKQKVFVRQNDGDPKDVSSQKRSATEGKAVPSSVMKADNEDDLSTSGTDGELDDNEYGALSSRDSFDEGLASVSRSISLSMKGSK